MRTPWSRLSQWVKSNCDDDWEHGEGVKIETLDNPGWIIRIDLQGTPVEGRTLQLNKTDRSESNWIQEESDGLRYVACGDLSKLEALVHLFLDFAKTGVREDR